MFAPGDAYSGRVPAVVPDPGVLRGDVAASVDAPVWGIYGFVLTLVAFFLVFFVVLP